MTQETQATTPTTSTPDTTYDIRISEYQRLILQTILESTTFGAPFTEEYELLRDMFKTLPEAAKHCGVSALHDFTA